MPGQGDIRANKLVREDLEALDDLRGDAFGTGSPSTAPASTEGQRQPTSPAERANEAMVIYLNQPAQDLPDVKSYPLTVSLQWWRDKGRTKFPLIAEAARCLLAIKASAGHIEQDFSLAGHMVGPRRSSLDPAYVDMVLVLKALKPDDVPLKEHVPELSQEELAAAIPKRYYDPNAIDIMRRLDRPIRAKRGSRQALVEEAMADEEVDAVLLGAFDTIDFDDALSDDEGDLSDGSGLEEDEEEDDDSVDDN